MLFFSLKWVAEDMIDVIDVIDVVDLMRWCWMKCASQNVVRLV